MTPLFWQHLLAIDPAGTRFRDLIKDLETSSLDPLSSLLSHPRLTQADRQKFSKLNQKNLQKAVDAGVQVIRPTDLDEHFLEVPRTPAALFHWGRAEPLLRPKIGIVGTRSASTYGRAAASKFAEAFSRAGVTVVSGGALGIDTAVHQGALKGHGGTIAVLGTGVERVFPASNRELYAEIREKGCLLSQFPVGTPSLRQNFPERNFTIAALSHALVVVEAPEISGALITARNSAEQGRTVFVLPGPITHRGFVGSHGLIRDGATLVDHPNQVLEQLNIEAAPEVKMDASQLSPGQQAIVATLRESPISAEKISEETGLDAAEVLAELTTMEMDGLVIRDAGGYAIKP